MLASNETETITGNAVNTDNSLRYMESSGTTSKSAKYFLTTQYLN